MTTAVRSRTVGWDGSVQNALPPSALKTYGFAPDETMLLFDARMCAYQAFYTRELGTSDGSADTSALHGMLEIVQAQCEAADTRRWLLVWDGGLDYKRAIYPAYKERHDADRTPEERERHARCQSSIRTAEAALAELGAPSLRVPQIECDDTIGLLAKWLSRRAGVDRKFPVRRVVIVSEDKDYYQLIDERISVWRRGRNELVDLKAFRERHQFEPPLYADYKALVGEPKTGDNIPGVPGIGDVYATRYVATCGPLEKVIGACRQLAEMGKPRKLDMAVVQHEQQARLSLRLARIMTRFEDLRPHGIRPDLVRHACAAALRRAACTARQAHYRDAIRFKGRYELASFDPDAFAARCGFRYLGRRER